MLTLLQSPGCNYTVLEGGQFLALHKLKALHLQGYAHEDKSQVSGYMSSSFDTNEKQKEKKESEQMKHLNLVLTEDALKLLTNLELLDLQYVRLLTNRDPQRYIKRSNIHPISYEDLIDLPLRDFLALSHEAKKITGSQPAIYDNPTFTYLSNSQLNNNQIDGDDNENDDDDDEDYDSEEEDDYEEEIEESLISSIEDNLNNIPDFKTYNSLVFDGLETEELVSYEVYVSLTQPHLAPFKTLNKLRYLRLAHARLDKIGPELLEGLHQLHTLTLEHNQIKFIPNDMFKMTPGLRHLSLAYNQIVEVEANIFSGLTKLLTLDLDFNRLSVIGPNTYPRFPQLSTIRMIGNPITHILPEAFINVNGSEKIYIGSPFVSTDVHNDAFKQLNKLKELVIENITHSILSKDFISGAPDLRILILHGNLSEIEFDTFTNSPKIEILDLSRCNIQTISMDAFFNLQNLKLLNLSHNEINNIFPGTFDYLPKLSELYLNDNKLTTLPPGIFLPSPSELIHVFNNPWDCSCDLVQLTPMTTNKMKRSSYIECQWDDKLQANCTTSQSKIVYDSRVAPLCSTPKRLKGQDVYHASLRYLKCSKEILNPKPAPTDNIYKYSTTTRKQTTSIDITKKKKPAKDMRYLPLYAYVPPTKKPVDLLEIALMDGLVPISDDYVNEMTTTITISTSSEKFTKKNDGFIQNDQQMDKNEKEINDVDFQQKQFYKDNLKESSFQENDLESNFIQPVTEKQIKTIPSLGENIYSKEYLLERKRIRDAKLKELELRKAKKQKVKQLMKENLEREQKKIKSLNKTKFLKKENENENYKP